MFTAWVETVNHRRQHSETGQAPLQRWMAGGPFALPIPDTLAEAFRWEVRRTVRKTATVSLHGNVYQVDPALVGRVVELVFDPFGLTRLGVRFHGRSWGLALPHRIDRHSHPKARPEIPPEPPTPTGIDYARLIDDAHQTQLAQGINYTALTGSTHEHVPGQLDLLTGKEINTEAIPADFPTAPTDHNQDECTGGAR